MAQISAPIYRISIYDTWIAPTVRELWHFLVGHTDCVYEKITEKDVHNTHRVVIVALIGLWILWILTHPRQLSQEEWDERMLYSPGEPKQCGFFHGIKTCLKRRIRSIAPNAKRD